MSRFMSHYYRRRQQYIDYLGGKCVSCGTIEKLEFDHIDPSSKSFSISGRLTHQRDKVIEELDKCQLLCKACHRTKTRENGDGFKGRVPWNKGSWKHGTQTGYRVGCRCDDCKKEYSRIRKLKYLKNRN